MPSIAFATCRNIPEPDADENLLLEACDKAGLDAELAYWDDAQIDWSRFTLVVPRSTWNYYEHEESFRQWVSTVSTVSELWNPAGLILRTIDKRYLDELEKQGVSIVPSRFIECAEELRTAIEDNSWTEFVLKPTVSGASFMTRRYRSSQLAEAAEFLLEIQRTHHAMVQKYMPRAALGGEVNLVHIDGKLTHGIIKYPRFQGDVEWVSEAAIVPTVRQTEVASKVLATVAEPWLYARVDLMEDEDGEWLLSELELIEPSLFFLQHEVSLDRFVGALGRLCLASRR